MKKKLTLSDGEDLKLFLATQIEMFIVIAAVLVPLSAPFYGFILDFVSSKLRSFVVKIAYFK